MKRNLFILVSVLILSVGAQVSAYDCKFEKERITKDLMQDVECVHDQECGYFNYGYPWQPDVCIKAIINVKKENHNISNLRLMAEYNNKCIYTDAEETKKYNDFKEQTTKAVCNEPVRVYCYKGFCRTQSYAIYNDE